MLDAGSRGSHASLVEPLQFPLSELFHVGRQQYEMHEDCSGSFMLCLVTCTSTLQMMVVYLPTMLPTGCAHGSRRIGQQIISVSTQRSAVF